MRSRKLLAQILKFCTPFTFLFAFLFISTQPALAQNQSNASEIQPLRSDVGINGLTANFHFLNDFTYLGNDTLETDGSSELEFVFRDVRMISQRLGVGFRVLTSFFVNDADGESSFGVGSWGLGPVVRAYPFRTANFQPYFEADAMMGNNMALGTLANTREGGNGFRVRLGLNAGVAIRFTNSIGIFIEGGPDWESSRLFKADARAWQVNVGLDLYRFN